VGTATIYSKKFDGRKTYSGQLFSSKKVSAAHPWLPMGTKVEVTNLKNKKKLIVTINDRMGKSSGYLLDMSAAAAKRYTYTTVMA
jgi:rare lipoprotein A